jgi:hypothetical protein
MPTDCPNPDEAIPGGARAQVSELMKMFGPSSTGEGNAASTVRFKVQWTERVRRRPRLSKMTDQELAEYDRQRCSAMRYVGEHVRPYDVPFHRWTADHIDQLVSDMLATLRETPVCRIGVVGSSLDSFRISVNRWMPWKATNGRFQLEIHGGGHDFSAHVDLTESGVPLHAIIDWIVRVDPFRIDITQSKRGTVTYASVNQPEDWEPLASSATTESTASTCAGATAAEKIGEDDGEQCDIQEDDDASDVENLIILRAVQTHVCREATWEQIAPAVRSMKAFLQLLHPGRRP